MDIQLYAAHPPPAVVDGSVAVYAAAFGQPPYRESAADAEMPRERIARYAGHAGFRLPVAVDLAGRIGGFALAVRAYPGDWWRDRVADAIGPELSARWLQPGVLEVVHLAVDPAVQRRGIGRDLLASLCDSFGASGPGTAVLSCDPAAVAAQHLYLSLGWHVITAELSYLPGMPPRWLMGAHLRRS